MNKPDGAHTENKVYMLPSREKISQILNKDFPPYKAALITRISDALAEYTGKEVGIEEIISIVGKKVFEFYSTIHDEIKPNQMSLSVILWILNEVVVVLTDEENNQDFIYEKVRSILEEEINTFKSKFPYEAPNLSEGSAEIIYGPYMDIATAASQLGLSIEKLLYNWGPLELFYSRPDASGPTTLIDGKENFLSTEEILESIKLGKQVKISIRWIDIVRKAINGGYVKCECRDEELNNTDPKPQQSHENLDESADDNEYLLGSFLLKRDVNGIQYYRQIVLVK
jgi:hypothetical protein